MIVIVARQYQAWILMLVITHPQQPEHLAIGPVGPDG